MKTVIVTGAANGVGKAVAEILKSENLILIDIDKENLERTANELDSKFFVCDLTSVNDINTMIEQIKQQYDRIDCLINCYGDSLREWKLSFMFPAAV